MSVLPIRVPGRAEPIEVPCLLPDCFDFRVFLPSRGVRIFTCWLTSTDPRSAEAKDVQLAHRETDPRLRDGFELDADEQRRADEDAGDVLQLLLNHLGMSMVGRSAYGTSNHALHGIAQAWSAEEDAVSRQAAMAMALEGAGMKGVGVDAYALVPDLDTYGGRSRSPAFVALAGYVAHALEQAILAQADKADRQQAEHSHARSDDEDGSERIRAPRSMDAATLKCLDVEC